MTDERLSFPVSTTSRLVGQTFTRFDSQYGLLALSEFAVGPEAIPACGEVFRSIALHYIGFVAHRHCALPTGKATEYPPSRSGMTVPASLQSPCLWV